MGDISLAFFLTGVDGGSPGDIAPYPALLCLVFADLSLDPSVLSRISLLRETCVFGDSDKAFRLLRNTRLIDMSDEEEREKERGSARMQDHERIEFNLLYRFAESGPSRRVTQGDVIGGSNHLEPFG